jgi:hypothetical protein
MNMIQYKEIMALLRLIHTCHAIPMPCCAAKGLDCVFPFDLHSVAVFDSPMPCPAHAILKLTSQGHGTAWAWRGMCELPSVVQRQHVGNLPAFGFFQLPCGVPQRLLSEAYQSLKL